MYQAATKAGDGAFNGLASAVVIVHGWVVTAGATAVTQVVVALVALTDVPVGEVPKIPAVGAHMSVSGASAETDKAPSSPQPSSPWVQRTCGMRAGPPPPIRPPKFKLSVPA